MREVILCGEGLAILSVQLITVRMATAQPSPTVKPRHGRPIVRIFMSSFK